MISDRAFCCLYQVSEHNICPLIVSGKGATSDAMEVGYFCNSTPMVNLTYFHSVSWPPYSPSPTFLLDLTNFTGLLPFLLFLFSLHSIPFHDLVLVYVLDDFGFPPSPRYLLPAPHALISRHLCLSFLLLILT